MGDVYYYKSVGWVTPLATTCKGKIISGNSLWVEKLVYRKQNEYTFRLFRSFEFGSVGSTWRRIGNYSSILRLTG